MSNNKDTIMRINKTIFLFFIFLISVTTSCKKDTENEIDTTKAENLKSLGVSAEDLLSEDTYKSMTIELVYTQSYSPLQESIDAFKNFITERVNKPDGITYVERIIPDPTGTSFTLDRIKEIEDENRTQYTVGDDIAVYIFFANAGSSTDNNTLKTLGAAYRNTSMVIYEKTIQEVAISQGIPRVTLETTTLNHEFGHLFGLVNIQNDDIHQTHEDILHAKHCKVEGCLMYYQSNSRSALLLKGKVTTPQFDSLCIEDLQAKGGK